MTVIHSQASVKNPIWSTKTEYRKGFSRTLNVPLNLHFNSHTKILIIKKRFSLSTIGWKLYLIKENWKIIENDSHSQRSVKTTDGKNSSSDDDNSASTSSRRHFWNVEPAIRFEVVAFNRTNRFWSLTTWKKNFWNWFSIFTKATNILKR